MLIIYILIFASLHIYNMQSASPMVSSDALKLQVKEAQLKATKMALSRAVAAADVPAYLARQELSKRGMQ